MNLGVGGDDVIGDLIELVEIGDGLPTGVLRKTRAGGNWLIGGIVIVRCSVVSRCYAFLVRSYGCRFFEAFECTFCGNSVMAGRWSDYDAFVESLLGEGAVDLIQACSKSHKPYCRGGESHTSNVTVSGNQTMLSRARERATPARGKVSGPSRRFVFVAINIRVHKRPHANARLDCILQMQYRSFELDLPISWDSRYCRPTPSTGLVLTRLRIPDIRACV